MQTLVTLPSSGLEIALWIAGVSISLLLITLLWRKIREGEKLKYEFITIIAHKFRTPLTQIRWNIEGLLDIEQDSHKKESLSEIAESNQHLINLTATLMEMADKAGGKSSYKFEKLDLCEMARNALDTAKRDFHEKNLFMALDCPDEKIIIKADRTRLSFLIDTLLENACNYTPPGRNVSLKVSATRRKATISVIDNGIGIEPKDMAKLFTKFYRTKSAQTMDTEGFGVGLYMANIIAKRHGGNLEAYSEGSGRGSTFSLTLKRTE